MNCAASHVRVSLLTSLGIALLCACGMARDINGVVRRPDGTPAEGARVRLYYLHDTSGFGCDWVGRETRTRANGTFSLPRPSLDHTPPVFIGRPVRMVYCVATMKGLAPAITECPPGPWPVQLELANARTVSVTVVDAADVSVGDAEVMVHRVSAGLDTMDVTTDVLAPLYRTLLRTRADRNGKATLADVPQANIGITAQHLKAGMGSVSLRRNRTEARIALSGTPATRGRIAPPEGTPLPTCVAIDVKGLAAGSVCWAHVAKNGTFALLSESVGLSPWASMQKENNALVIAAIETAREPRLGALAVSLPETERGNAPSIPFPAGRRVEGQATNELDGEPIPGAIILAVLGANSPASFHFYQASDAHGRFAFRLPTDAPVKLRVVAAPNGSILVPPLEPGKQVRDIEPTGDALNADLVARALPAVYVCVRVRLDKDTVVPGASVMAQQAGLRPVLAIADSTGRATVGPLIKGATAVVFANGKDESRAVQELIPATEVREINELDVTLGSSVNASVIVTDKAGKELAAHVTVSLAAKDATVPVARAVAATPEEMKEGLELAGLVRGKTYKVTVNARDRAEQEIDWVLPAKGEIAPLRIALEGEQAAQIAAQPPVPKTKEALDAFARERAALKDTTWEKPDPCVKGMTWYGLPHGIAVVDENALKVRRFTEFFGQGRLKPTAIAFGPKAVYVGTEKGLAVYSRETLGWTRLVVGGIFIDRPVRALTMNDGTLRVTVVAPNGNTPAYDLDTADGGWTKVKK